jgi:hypothetical protein
MRVQPLLRYLSCDSPSFGKRFELAQILNQLPFRIGKQSGYRVSEYVSRRHILKRHCDLRLILGQCGECDLSARFELTAFYAAPSDTHVFFKTRRFCVPLKRPVQRSLHLPMAGTFACLGDRFDVRHEVGEIFEISPQIIKCGYIPIHDDALGKLINQTLPRSSELNLTSHQERNLGVDAVVGNLAVFYLGPKFANENRLDIAHSLLASVSATCAASSRLLSDCARTSSPLTPATFRFLRSSHVRYIIKCKSNQHLLNEKIGSFLYGSDGGAPNNLCRNVEPNCLMPSGWLSFERTIRRKRGTGEHVSRSPEMFDALFEVVKPFPVNVTYVAAACAGCRRTSAPRQSIRCPQPGCARGICPAMHYLNIRLTRSIISNHEVRILRLKPWTARILSQGPPMPRVACRTNAPRP